MKSGYDQFFKEIKKNAKIAKNHPRPSSRVQKKSSFKFSSSLAFLLTSIFLVGSIWMFINTEWLEWMERQLERIEVNFFSPGMAQDEQSKKNQEVKSQEINGTKTETKGSKEPVKSSNPNLSQEVKNSSEKGPEAKSSSEKVSEELSHYSQLNERKKELDLREKELNELEEELHKQKSEIEGRIQHLEKLRGQISQVLQEKVEGDQQKVKTLVEFYSNMKPQQAAKIIETLNEDLAIEVLSQMKKKNAAEIMNLLAPAKAQVISEKFAGYKRR